MPPAPGSATRQRTPPRPEPTAGNSRRRDAPGPEPASRPAPDQPAATRGPPQPAQSAGAGPATRSDNTPAPVMEGILVTVLTSPIGPDLKHHLRALKPGRLLDILPERLTLARQQNMTHADFLELVLADEVSRRESGSAALRARAAGL